MCNLIIDLLGPMGLFALFEESFICLHWSPISKGFMMNVSRRVFLFLVEAKGKNKNKTQVTILPVTSLSGNTNTEPAAFCVILRQLTAHPFSSPLQRALAYVGIKEQKHDEGEKGWVIFWIFYPGIGKLLTSWVLESLHTYAHTHSHPMIFQGNYIICSLHLAVRTLIYDFSLAATTTSTGFSTILHNNYLIHKVHVWQVE